MRPTPRIIARLDIKGPHVVKPVHAEGLRVVGDPTELATKYYASGADELIYLDIVASLYQRNLDFEQLKLACKDVFVPLTVGGGIRSLHDMEQALRAGADKVAVNTYAVHHPEFITDASERFGAQSVTLSVEAKKIGESKWEAYTDGGRERSGVDVVEWVGRAIALGAGEILLTSIDTDGVQKGYDLDLIRAVTMISSVPVVAHGGAGSAGDMTLALSVGADAVSASSIYHYGIHTIPDIRHDLQESGIRVRTIYE